MKALLVPMLNPNNMTLYTQLQQAKKNGTTLLAVLVDPDKMQPSEAAAFAQRINQTTITVILVGGSTVDPGITEPLVQEIKQHTNKPIYLFPGDTGQLTHEANGLLLLSLLSGRNAKYLIEEQIASASFIRKATMEIISTGYILIEGGTETATMKVTHTLPIPHTRLQLIKDTAKAGEAMGNKLIYLEAGSGALAPVPATVIKEVNNDVALPIIVGGGIRSFKTYKEACHAGAAMVVIGTAFENNADFFNEFTTTQPNTQPL